MHGIPISSVAFDPAILATVCVVGGRSFELIGRIGSKQVVGQVVQQSVIYRRCIGCGNEDVSIGKQWGLLDEKWKATVEVSYMIVRKM